MVLAKKIAYKNIHDGFSFYLSLAAQYHPISTEEELNLARRMRDENDVEAGQKLILSNLRYVVKIALEYRRYGCDLNELVQAGNLGLAEAVKRFDPDRNTRLVTYASWWIRDAVRQCIARSRSVSARGTTRAERRLLGNTSAPNGPKKDIPLDMIRSSDIPTEASPEYSAIFDQESERLRYAVTAALKNLDPRERLIADLRFLAEKPRSLADIGSDFGVSRERARQIAERTLTKIRKQLKTDGFTCPDITG